MTTKVPPKVTAWQKERAVERVGRLDDLLEGVADEKTLDKKWERR
jgi:hypothetical protein